MCRRAGSSDDRFARQSHGCFLRGILSHRRVLRRCLHDACKPLHRSPCLVVGQCLWAFDLRLIDPQHEVPDSLHDVLPRARATARSIRHHLRCEQAPRNAPRPHCLAASTQPPTQGQRNAASSGSAHLWQPGRTISNPRSALTRMADVDVLSCCSGSSSGSCTSLKATKHLTKLASTSSTEINPSWASTCNVLALPLLGNRCSSGNGNFPAQGFRCDNSFSSVGMQTRRQVSTFQPQCLLVIILPEGEATQPLRSALGCP